MWLEDLMPQVGDDSDLGEEAVATDIEAPAVTHGGPTDAAHHDVGLQHGGSDSGLAELVGGGQAGGPATDDDRS